MPVSDAFSSLGGGTWGKFLLVAFVATMLLVYYFASLLLTVGVVAVVGGLAVICLYYAGIRVDQWARYGGQ